MADETGSIPYSLWDTERVALKAGDVFMLRTATPRNTAARVQVNLGNRAVVGGLPEDEVVADTAVVRAAWPWARGAGQGGPAGRRNEQRDGDGKGPFGGAEGGRRGGDRRWSSGDDGRRDRKGRSISAWHDFGLKPNEVVKIAGPMSRVGEGVPKLNFGESPAVVARLTEDSMPDVEASRPKPRTIEDMEKVGGATDALVKAPSWTSRKARGLIIRCPQCKRVVQKGACRMHGKVEGYPDLRVKAVLDDGNCRAHRGHGPTASRRHLLGMNLEEACRQAREAMNAEVIRRTWKSGCWRNRC